MAWQPRTVQGLTTCSSGAPTACHQRPAGGTRYIFASPGLASHRRCQLSSNVRPHNPSLSASTQNDLDPPYGGATSWSVDASPTKPLALRNSSFQQEAVRSVHLFSSLAGRNRHVETTEPAPVEDIALLWSRPSEYVTNDGAPVSFYLFERPIGPRPSGPRMGRP